MRGIKRLPDGTQVGVTLSVGPIPISRPLTNQDLLEYRQYEPDKRSLFESRSIEAEEETLP